MSCGHSRTGVGGASAGTRIGKLKTFPAPCETSVVIAAQKVAKYATISDVHCVTLEHTYITGFIMLISA